MASSFLPAGHRRRVATPQTEDDERVLGRRGPVDYEYEPREYGEGLVFDWWPDLYALAEGDRYEVPLPDDCPADPDLLQGDDAINIPLFALLLSVVDQASLSGLKLGESFELTAQIGSHWLEARWPPGQRPDTARLIKHLASEFEASEAGLRPKIAATHDALAFRIRTIQAGDATINFVGFIGEGENLISFGADGMLRIWQAGTGQLLREVSDPDANGSAALSPLGDTAITFGFEPTMRLWELATCELRAELRGHDEGIECAAPEVGTTETKGARQPTT